MPEVPPQAAPKPELGSSEVSRRVAAIAAPASPTPVDRFTGKLICHRFYIPFDVQTPAPNALNPKQMDIKVNAQMANVPCLGIKCALWNDAKKECKDVTALDAQVRIAEALDRMDAFSRMHSQEG